VAAYLRPIAVVFSNRELRRLQLAWAGSSLGTCAYLIALAVVAFRSAGGRSRLHHARPNRGRSGRGGAAVVGGRPLLTPRRHGGQRPHTGRADRRDRDPHRDGRSDRTIYVLATAIAVVSTVFRPAQAR
jgi:hypothetical protein